MSFIINANISALNTYNLLSENSNALASSTQKLSSGKRINKAADDAAGLAISLKMQAQITGLDQANRNSQDGVSLIQTAEGALNETQSMLQRARELAVQASNDTYTTADRQKIKAEASQLFNEINRIASTTQFNTKKLLNSGVKFTFQVGANSGQTITFSINKMLVSTIAGAKGSTLVYTTQSGCGATIAALNSAINTVAKELSNMGAYQNRLEHTMNNLTSSSENLTAAQSRIQDVDMAKEMTNYTKENILVQAGTAMLAQANQQPSSVLSLLK